MRTPKQSDSYESHIPDIPRLLRRRDPFRALVQNSLLAPLTSDRKSDYGVRSSVPTVEIRLTFKTQHTVSRAHVRS